MKPPDMLQTTTALLVLARATNAVDLTTCKATLQARLDNKTLSRNDPIFYFNGTTFMSEPDNIWLTIQGCKSNCPNPDFDLYSDMWPRLLTWLVPALLLIGNVHLPRVGHLNRLLVILHFIGDPIDSTWALLTKAEVWNRFYALALRFTPPGPDRLSTAKALAAMLSAFEELTGDMVTVQQEFNAIVSENGARLSKDDLDYILLETADELIDSRSNEGLRTGLVIINYLWAVLAALVPEIGGIQTSQPGGRIGTAMFLSWLVTTVLLSNTLSGFTSRRTCLRIMERYTRTIKGRHRDLHHFPCSPHLLSQSKSTPTLADFIKAQPWNGSVYSYRPRKRLPSISPTDRSPLHLLFLSTTPILVASASAFTIIWYTPTIGLGCRTLWVISLTATLLLSPLLTYIICKLLRGRWAWYLTILKDTIIGLTCLVVIILSSIGIFNTCWCWSGVYSRGYSRAFIDLDPATEREHNLHRLYPAMVGVCLGLQIVCFVAMHRVMKAGGGVFRPSEEEKMERYRAVHGGEDEREMERKGPSVEVLVLPEPAMGSPGDCEGYGASPGRTVEYPLLGRDGRWAYR
ncbi:hypothetical protein OQA88_5748 [Cercophora sp. LCS_1]